MISTKRKRSGSITLKYLDNLNINYQKKKKSENIDNLTTHSTEVSLENKNNELYKEKNLLLNKENEKKNFKNINYKYDYHTNLNITNNLLKPNYCPNFYKKNFNLNKQLPSTHLNHIISKKESNNKIIIISSTQRISHKNVKFIYYSLNKNEKI